MMKLSKLCDAKNYWLTIPPHLLLNAKNSLCALVTQITGVLTQGRNDGQEWVTSFMVSHSMDAYQWLYITDLYGNQKVSCMCF